MKFPIETAPGSYLTPRYEHATVGDVMRHGVITCSPQTTLRTIARMMSSYHVHAIVVTEDEGEGRLSPWGLVSDFDLLRAAHAGAEDLTAGEVSRSPAVFVAPDDTLPHAADLMREHGTGHLVVISPTDSRPVGVVSTLDVAGALAWGEV
jgi:CBS domain-containing protein